MSTEGVHELVMGAMEEIFTDPETVLDDDFEEAARLYIGVALNAMGRYDENKNMDDLETAIGLFDKGINHPTAANDPLLPAYVNKYATALAKRFGINHNAEDLQKAIGLVKTAFRTVDMDKQEYDQVLQSAWECLSAMYEVAGSADALHEIIVYGKEALQSMPSKHAKRPDVFHMLSRCLQKRFTLAGELADIDDAVSYAGEAIEWTPEEENDKLASHFSLVSNCLYLRFSLRIHDLDDDSSVDIQYAVEYGEESVERTRKMGSGAEEDLTQRLTILSAYYWANACSGPDKKPADLDKAFAAATEACDLASKMESLKSGLMLKSSLMPMALACLAQCFHSKFSRDNSWEDLKESISLGYKAMDYGAASDKLDWKLSSELAYRLLLAHKYSLNHPLPQIEDSMRPGSNYLDESIEKMCRAIQSPHMTTSELLAAVFVFTDLVLEFEPILRRRLAGRLDHLLTCAVELLPRETQRPLGQDQQRILSRYYRLASDTAAASLEAGNHPYEALRLLELGRGVLISMQLGARMPIPELQKQHPALADEYIKLHNELQSSKITEQPFERRHEITTGLRDLLAKIRQKPGFEVFGQTLGKGEMMRLADRGPIVVLNISKFRCDAIAVLSDEIKVINLPDLDVDFLGEKSLELQYQLAAIKDAQKDFHLLYKNLTELLKITWRQVMNPTLKALGFTKRPRDENSWPHIWWIPTEHLCLVPIHAAGIPGKATVMDRVISSYIPSVKALEYARAKHQNSIPSADDGGATDRRDVRALVIAMADTPERTRLDHSMLEAKAVIDSFPNTIILEQPTRQAVVTELETPPSIIHFSCHGETDDYDPTKSKLLLSDWKTSPLDVSQLQRLSLQGSKLAYLSACWAAHGGNLDLRNENIHLVSACQLAGFPSAIGSFWYVGQDASLKAVEAFYKEIGKGGNSGGFDVLEAGRVLHFTILGLRESTKSAGNDFKGDPVRWAPFVHFGI
ncbi:hypothetical protein HOY80DRAFT_912481 [Tuber brumale]|nr:hypothetical protein HOY80DRAFT_912481 [Tuber brumale]